VRNNGTQSAKHGFDSCGIAAGVEKKGRERREKSKKRKEEARSIVARREEEGGGDLSLG